MIFWSLISIEVNYFTLGWEGKRRVKTNLRYSRQQIIYGMIERKQSEDTARRIIVAWFWCSFGVELVPTMSVFGESLGENQNSLEADCSYRFWGWSKASSVKMNWILLFHLIRFSQLGLVSLRLRMKGWRGKKEMDNCRQQVFHTLQQIDKSFQRPQK